MTTAEPSHARTDELALIRDSSSDRFHEGWMAAALEEREGACAVTATISRRDAKHPSMCPAPRPPMDRGRWHQPRPLEPADDSPATLRGTPPSSKESVRENGVRARWARHAYKDARHELDGTKCGSIPARCTSRLRSQQGSSRLAV